MQAYLLGLPPVNQLANKSAILSMGPANKTVPIWEQLVDSRTVELTANDNTAYTWFWLDLRNGPLVLEVPPKVLGLIDDMWYHWVVDLGITGPDKGRGGKYLLLPPGYKGEVPKGYHVVRCPTYSVWPVWRSFLVDGDPKPGVDAGQEVHQDLSALAGRQSADSSTSWTCRASRSTWSGRRVTASGKCSIRSCRRNRPIRSIRPPWVSGPPSASRRASRSLRTRA